MVLSSLFTGPLFSTIITFYLLILLYFPTLFLGIIFSPILISTSLLLLSLLRLGAIQDKNKCDHPTPAENNVVVGHDCQTQRVSSKPDDSPVAGSGSCDYGHQGQFHANASFVEWDVRAPLEVIYEEYCEGQSEEGDDVSEEKKDDAHMDTFERYASLSKFYPETDSDTSEEDDFPSIGGWDQSGNIGFRWVGEDRDGMIEIELYEKAYSDIEEESLIEIDLHPASLPSR